MVRLGSVPSWSPNGSNVKENENISDNYLFLAKTKTKYLSVPYALSVSQIEQWRRVSHRARPSALPYLFDYVARKSAKRKRSSSLDAEPLVRHGHEM